MTKICINIDEPLKIGEISSGEIELINEPKKHIAIKVLREINLNEYLDFVKKHKLSRYVNRNIHDKYLYEVEVLD